MAIDVYEGIPRKEITAERTTSEGKKYTLDHPDELIVNMRYKGEGKSNANSQGWERSSVYFFKELQTNHSEIFSKKNNVRIDNGESPRVDAKFVKSFPQYKGYENETLIHHHIGKDGQAVALPQSMHKGSGEIHIYENKLGITDNARRFSDKCKDTCAKNPKMVDQTADKFKGSVQKQTVSSTHGNTQKQMASTHGNVQKQTVSTHGNVKQNAITRASTGAKASSNNSTSKTNSIKAATTKSTSTEAAKSTGTKSRSK
jgi:putative transposase or phage integrase